MIWSHVTGLVMSRPADLASDLRYQSSWVLAQNGAATSLPFQGEACTEGFTMSWVNVPLELSGTSARKPASANSATNTGSRLMIEIDESLAARRVTSCCRWALA